MGAALTCRCGSKRRGERCDLRMLPLRSVAGGWTSRHRDEPALLRVWLVQDQISLVDGRVGRTRLAELATWELPS